MVDCEVGIVLLNRRDLPYKMSTFFWGAHEGFNQSSNEFHDVPKFSSDPPPFLPPFLLGGPVN